MTVPTELHSLFDKLSTYEGRKSTFPGNWSSIHPEETLSSHMMAKAGFYHLRGDLVKCYYCEKELENWEPDDNVYQEHKDHAKYCPFVKMFPREAPNSITLQQAIVLERDRVTLSMDRDFEKWKAEIIELRDKNIAKILKESTKSNKPRKNRRIKK